MIRTDSLVQRTFEQVFSDPENINGSSYKFSIYRKPLAGRW